MQTSLFRKYGGGNYINSNSTLGDLLVVIDLVAAGDSVAE
jgi:hypothetical protein